MGLHSSSKTVGACRRRKNANIEWVCSVDNALAKIIAVFVLYSAASGQTVISGGTVVYAVVNSPFTTYTQIYAGSSRPRRAATTTPI